MRTLITRAAIVALAALGAPRASAHDLDCEKTVGVVVPGQDGVALGEDGLPTFLSSPGPTLTLDRYPALVGFKIRVSNAAPADVSRIETASDSLTDGLAGALSFGAELAPGLELPIGGDAERVVVVPVASYEACLALGGAPADLACRPDGTIDNRFVATHDSGSVECRARLVCVPAEPSCTPESCDDGNACTTDTCDVEAGCVNVPKGCDDGSACTTDSCDPATGCVSTPVVCDDGVACTTDGCDPAAGCTYAPSNAACDDGSACTTDACDAQTGCVSTPVVCDDGVTCTTDGCDPATGCTYAPSNAACDDGSACTTDACDAQAGCVSTPVVCEDGVACTTNGCDPATGCAYTPSDALCADDGNACTTAVCDAETGCGTTPVVCDDGVACTVNACDATTGCGYTPSNALCDDGDACTTDVCDAQTGCGTTPVVCDDGIACTVDACDAEAGCTYTPSPALCPDDDNVCTAATCGPNGCGTVPVNNIPCGNGGTCQGGTCRVRTNPSWTGVLQLGHTDAAPYAATLGIDMDGQVRFAGTLQTFDEYYSHDPFTGTVSPAGVLAPLAPAGLVGEFGAYVDLAVDLDGALYLADFEAMMNVRKVGADGATAWEQMVAIVPSAIALDAAGNVYVVGSQWGADAVAAAVAKLDAATGDVDWLQTLPAATMSEGYGVAVGPDGDVFVAGTLYNAGTLADAFPDDAFVARFTPDGAWLWTTPLGSPAAFEMARAVAVDAGGYAMVAGSTTGAIGAASVNAGGLDAFVARLDPDGNVVWGTQLGSAGDDTANAIALDAAGAAWITGAASDALPGQTALGLLDVLLAKIDATGGVVAVRQLGTDGNEQGADLALDGTGRPFVTGTTEGAWSGPLPALYVDAFVAAFDVNGDL